MTLNTFHFAGVGAKNVTLGVPRLKELINVAKNIKTPSLAIYLHENLSKSQERAKDVQSVLEHTTLEKVTSFTQIFWDPDPVNTFVKEDKEWVAEYYELPDEDENPDKCGPWLLRIQLSNKVMTDKKLTVREVGERIIGDFYGDLDCIFTDDNAEELVLRIRLLKEKDALEQEPGPFDPDDDSDDKDFKFLRSIEANILKEMTLKGILGIKKVFMREDTVNRYNKTEGKFDRAKEWVLDTDGINLEEVLNLPEVDFARVQSNNLVEILNILGIEATRQALLFHVRMVISFDGSYVNYRHLGTLCDVMTNRGHMMAITRHGINRTNMGPLMKCSFEETVEILMDAAIYNEMDHMRSVSENVIFGQLCPVGTGVFDIHMDDQRTKHDDGTEGPCALDLAAPVLPSSKNELFSTSSPIRDSGNSPIPGKTPREVDMNIGMQTDEAEFADMPTPMVSAIAEVEADIERSPFSVAGDMGTPFDVSPTGPLSSPFISEMTSPASVVGSPTSPEYSPVEEKDELSKAQPSLSPSHYEKSPAYTPSGPSGPTHATSPRYSGLSKRSHYTSPAYTPSGAGRTSPYGAWSPTYSPSATSAVGGFAPRSALATSPAYTPRSAAYTPTSPAYEPSYPAYLRSSPRMSVTSPAMSPDVHLEAGPSPVIQQEGSPEYDVPTSPSYTPHQTHASGARGDKHTSEHFQSESFEDVHSAVFEESDDEMDGMAIDRSQPDTAATAGEASGGIASGVVRGAARGDVEYSPTSPE
jgi:DNA-directed RNA polymerase II subunit RPB1